MTRREYAKKLKDPRWQRIRLKVLERDNFKCQYPNCNHIHAQLHVHHIKYYSGDPWDTPLKYLISYCEIHHKLKHKKSNAKK
jgi:5-methylcytosine-specific restriction endonuclease McrA